MLLTNRRSSRLFTTFLWFSLQADEAYHIGPPPSQQSYLCMEKVLEIAKKSGSHVSISPPPHCEVEQKLFSTHRPDRFGPFRDQISFSYFERLFNWNQLSCFTLRVNISLVKNASSFSGRAPRLRLFVGEHRVCRGVQTGRHHLHRTAVLRHPWHGH